MFDKIKKIILFPYYIYKDFKENLQFYELEGMKLVHGGKKGVNKFRKKYEVK